MVSEKKIHKDTTLSEVLRYKGAEEILNKYNVPCLTCPMMSMEMNKLTLKQISEMYDLDLEGLIKELNQIANSK